MFVELLREKAKTDSGKINELFPISLTAEIELNVYSKSINELSGVIYFIANAPDGKFLFLAPIHENIDYNAFEGTELIDPENSGNILAKKCALSRANALEIKKRFSFTKPILLGKQNSIGFGDRLGLANPAHIRSLENSKFKPIIAQQSIRELTRTQRTPEEIMDAAVWAVFQEGYRNGFGSDADHLKTTEDIDLMINAGFTMFTFDPGEFVINEADTISIEELEDKANTFNWNFLEENLQSLVNRYENVEFDFKEGLIIKPNYEDVLRAIVKYSNAVAHIKTLYNHLSTKYSNLPYEVEISVDETESVTTPFEHFFIASELKRLEVKIVSLAPRFIGDFEKGIEYKGDIEVFKEEYLKHVKIAEYFGSYKISLHSGSDKFDVYAAIGSLRRGYTHVKTAGTSYLEAVKVIANKDPDLFREILNFARGIYLEEKVTYHVSGDINKVKSAVEYSDTELVELFTQNDARQVLHVTFGKVLTAKKENGGYLFRDRLMNCIRNNEELHYRYLYNHFRRHLKHFEIK